MPKRTDIHKVMIIGSGPIIVGQACEFDCSGTQACKALKSLGHETVLVNSNPATTMMEHVELAGVHSGDSACILPPISIQKKHIDTINEYTKKIVTELNVVGLLNIQYAIADDTAYILDANPCALRTVPLISNDHGFVKPPQTYHKDIDLRSSKEETINEIAG